MCLTVCVIGEKMTSSLISTHDDKANLPKITIITVVFNLIQNNREEVMRRCVASIRAQTYPNIEHIVIDGASQDGTIDLLKSLNLNFISEKDSGIYDAMNKGIKWATGKYIAFMNSDDYYASDTALEQVMQKFQETQADAVYGDAIICGHLRKPRFLRKSKIEGIFHHMSLCHQSFVSSVASMKEIPFDTKYKVDGDYDYIYKMLLSGKLLVHIPLAISCFQLGGISFHNNRVEDVHVIRENLSRVIRPISFEMAKEIMLSRGVPLSFYLGLRKLIHPKMRASFDRVYIKKVLRYNWNRFFVVRTRKHARCVRLFGITFWEKTTLKE